MLISTSINVNQMGESEICINKFVFSIKCQMLDFDSDDYFTTRLKLTGWIHPLR